MELSRHASTMSSDTGRRGSLIYASFDRFPAPKGAATHIRAFVEALSRQFDAVELVTVAASSAHGFADPFNGSADPARPGCPATATFHHLPATVQHTPLPALGATLIERVLHFREQLRSFWRDRRPDVAHVRSIFEGYPIARDKRKWCDRMVLEVNGLPTIELKYHYPRVADDRELMAKLYAQEQCCLAEADLVLTVSRVNAAYLRSRGVPLAKLRVIPNGVDPELFDYQPPRAWDDREVRFLYSGTLSPWQGVGTAIEALALYRRDAPARLAIVGDARPGQRESLRKLAKRLGVLSYVDFPEPATQAELAGWHHLSEAVLAPLIPNDRNLVQGCCPLKVLEAMASGTPLVASGLPVVTALARPEVDALIVRPGSAKAIKDALSRLRSDAGLAMRISLAARARIESRFTWRIAGHRLRKAYRLVGPSSG